MTYNTNIRSANVPLLSSSIWANVTELAAYTCTMMSFPAVCKMNVWESNTVIKSIEYRCDDCNNRLFDLVSDLQEIEIKCPKCKETMRVGVEELHRFLHFYSNLQLNKCKKVNESLT